MVIVIFVFHVLSKEMNHTLKTKNGKQTIKQRGGTELTQKRTSVLWLQVPVVKSAKKLKNFVTTIAMIQ
jgi:hypothetical protein